MRTHNMLAEYYKVLSDIEIEQRGLADSSGLFIPTLKVVFVVILTLKWDAITCRQLLVWL